MDSGESLCCQYLALEAFPQCEYVCSAFHAGFGQVSFGSNWRQKADCTFSCREETTSSTTTKEEEEEEEKEEALTGQRVQRHRRRIRVFNYHGSAYHGRGKHLTRCRLKHEDGGEGCEFNDNEGGGEEGGGTFEEGGPQEEQEEEENEEEEEEEEEEETEPPLDEEWADLPASVRGLKKKLRRLQLLHQNKLKKRAVVARRGRRPMPALSTTAEGEDDSDGIKRCYAEALTAVDPNNLCFSYDVVHECDLFHGGSVPDPKRWGGEGNKAIGGYPGSLRSFLRRFYKEDSVLGLGTTRLSQEQLVKKIVENPPNSDGENDFGGFVVLTGGKETRTGDILEGQFGFCHQRTTLSPAQLGPFTRWQATELYGSDAAAAKKLKTLCGQPGTLSRTSFHAGGETLSLEYFRWLIRERGLEGYKIRHFIFYRHKKYLSKYLRWLLQRRYDLRKEKNSDLMRNLLKLLCNGFYGGCAFFFKNVLPDSRIIFFPLSR